MKAAPRWRAMEHPRGGYRGPMVRCSRCGYASWKAATCPYCGEAFQTPPTGNGDGAHRQTAPVGAGWPRETGWSFPTLFLVWFSLGLFLGILGFSPRTWAAGAQLWSHVERVIPPVKQGAALELPASMSSDHRGPNRTGPIR